MSEPRHLEPVPLGDADVTLFQGADGARADRHRHVSLRARTSWPAASRAASTRAARVDLDRMHELAVEILGEKEGGQAMRRLLRYRELQELDLPIILLVGGATGTGKSTIATEVAYRLGISRVTSTDFVRQTMRAFFSREFMPSIHYSSFEAGRAVSGRPASRRDPAGFLEQTRNVLVGVQAAIDRVLEEGWSMVLEGVHLVPGMLPVALERAVLVQCVLEHRGPEHARRALRRPRRRLGRLARAWTSTSSGSRRSARSRSSSSAAPVKSTWRSSRMRIWTRAVDRIDGARLHRSGEGAG